MFRPSIISSFKKKKRSRFNFLKPSKFEQSSILHRAESLPLLYKLITDLRQFSIV